MSVLNLNFFKVLKFWACEASVTFIPEAQVPGYVMFDPVVGSTLVAIVLVCIYFFGGKVPEPDPKDPKEQEKARRRRKVEQDRKRMAEFERAIEAARKKAEAMRQASSRK